MTLPEIDIQLIEKYIDGILTDSEKRLFDDKYAHNPAFKQETEAYKKVLKAIQVGGRQNIMAIFSQEEAKIQEKTLVVPMPTFKYRNILRGFVIAASIAFVASASIWLLQSKEQTGEDILKSVEIRPMGNTWTTNVRSQRSDGAISPKEKYFIATYGENNTELLLQAFEFYNTNTVEGYTKAAATFAQVTAKNDSLYLYKGISYLKANAPDKAVESLKNLANTENAAFKPNAEWYLMLAYLKQNDLTKAKVLKEKIMNAAVHVYKPEASKVKF